MTLLFPPTAEVPRAMIADVVLATTRFPPPDLCVDADPPTGKVRTDRKGEEEKKNGTRKEKVSK